MNTEPANKPDGFPMTASRGFVDWLASQRVSLAFSTYQTGKLFVVGHNDDGRFSVYERTFERAMGLAGGLPAAGDGQTIYMATLYQLWRLENVLAVGETLEGYDRYYVPQVGPGHVDLATGKFQEVAFCPGFARGLTFIGDYAVVGLSLPRHDPTFEGLALQGKLAAAKVSARCGLLMINLTSGDAVEWLRLEEPLRELYDVLALPGVRRPRLVGFKSDEIRTRVWGDPDALARLR